VLFQHLREGTKKNHKNIKYSWSPGKDLNQTLPKYEAGALTTQLQFSVENKSKILQHAEDLHCSQNK
jgi:hypothetical protein